MAVDFEGDSGEYLECGAADETDNLTSMSVSLWLKPESMGTNHHVLVAKLPAAHNSVLAWIYSFNAADMRMHWKWSGAEAYWTSNTNISNGTLYHCVWTYNPGGGTGVDPVFYLNASSQAVSEGAAPSGSLIDDSAGHVHVGGGTSWANSADGLIEDVRIFGRILSQADVNTLYGAGTGYSLPLGDELIWLKMTSATGVTKAAFDAGESLDAGETIPDDANANDGVPTNTPHGSPNLLAWLVSAGQAIMWWF